MLPDEQGDRKEQPREGGCGYANCGAYGIGLCPGCRREARRNQLIAVLLRSWREAAQTGTPLGSYADGVNDCADDLEKQWAALLALKALENLSEEKTDSGVTLQELKDTEKREALINRNKSIPSEDYRD